MDFESMKEFSVLVLAVVSGKFVSDLLVFVARRLRKK